MNAENMYEAISLSNFWTSVIAAIILGYIIYLVANYCKIKIKVRIKK